MDVKNLCLGVLTMGEASGYEIKKAFEESFSHFYAAGFGSIYPALAKLTQLGYVTCSNIEQEKRPAKKVYRLTEVGRRAFADALAETYPEHRVRSDFMVLAVFAHLQGHERMAEVLDIRLADIEQQIALINDCVDARGHAGPGVEFAAGYARTVLQAGHDYIRRHRKQFLDALTKLEASS